MVFIKFVVGIIHCTDERRQYFRNVFYVTVLALQLPPQQWMQCGHACQISVKAVMVMVWLCSSQVSPGVKGEISP